MARKELPADYIGDVTQLQMVLEAREVLARDGATDAEWAANSTLINRYSNGAYTAEGTSPAVRVEGVALPAGERDYRPADWTRPTGTGTPSRAAAPKRRGPEPSGAQKDLYLKLVHANLVGEEIIAAAVAKLDTLTKTTISPIIDNLLVMDRAREQQERTAARTGTNGRKSPLELDQSLPTVPAGSYRVAGRNVKVDTPTQGQYAGRVFLVELDDEGRKMDRISRHADKLTLLTEIAADPHGCLVAYGQATGECGHCHTHLEDPESVARGVGPYCEAGSLGISVAEVYRDRKANPVAREAVRPATETPAPVSERKAPAPKPRRQAPATPAPAAAAPVLDSLTPDAVDALTFPEAMNIAKAIKLPGRGTARLPQLRDGIRAALALAA